MSRNQEKISASGIIILILVMLNVIIIKSAFIHDAQIYWGLVITLPLLFIAIFDAIKNKYAIRSEFRKLRTSPTSGILRAKALLRKSKVADESSVERERTERLVKKP